MPVLEENLSKMLCLHAYKAKSIASSPYCNIVMSSSTFKIKKRLNVYLKRHHGKLFSSCLMTISFHCNLNDQTVNQMLTQILIYQVHFVISSISMPVLVVQTNNKF